MCVPTEKLGEASALLNSVDTYETYPPRPPEPRSLLHTFPRFKLVGIAMAITLVPSDDAHIDCIAPNIERSQMGIPYPVLEIFAQSLLDTYDIGGLQSLVDGMDLTEQWGLDHLKLDAENDVAWARRKNEKIRASVPLSFGSCFLEVTPNPFNLKETWNEIVRTKKLRIGIELPEGYFSTQFRAAGSPDPRSIERDCV